MYRNSEWLEYVVRRVDSHVSHHMPLPPHLLCRLDSWKDVQTSIIKLFQRKPLGEQELGQLQETIRALSEAEAGSLIYEYYKDQLLKKGMVILREKIKNEQGAELLTMLGETWDYFFREIVPTLQALMYPLASVMKGVDIRNTTLLEFRNIVVLKVGLKDAVEGKKYQVPANIRQMLLVLQGLRDPTFLSKEQLDLEKMAACVIVPFLGTRGLYQGTPDPVIRANFRPPPSSLPPPLLSSSSVPGVSRPNITITVYEDSAVSSSNNNATSSTTTTTHHYHHHHHHLPTSPLASPLRQRLEQQHHPIVSPAAMRKKHPPLPTSASSPSSTSSSTTSIPVPPPPSAPPPPPPKEGSATLPRLTPVIEVTTPEAPPLLDRRHSIVGT